MEKLSKSQAIYIGNLPDDINEHKLYELFSKFGKVTHMRIAKDFNQPQKNMDFAFIKMESEEDMKKAVNQLQDFYYEGRYLITRLIDEQPE